MKVNLRYSRSGQSDSPVTSDGPLMAMGGRKGGAMRTRTGGTWRRWALYGAAVAGVVLAGGVGPAGATLTTPACQAKKLKEWGKLRKCQATEKGKAVQAKPFDLAKCQTNFDEKLA